MARRRDRDPLQIDLSPDDGDLGDGGWADAPDGSAGVPTDGPVDPAPGWFATRVTRPLHERWRGMPRRLRVGVVSGAAAVVAVTVAGVAVVDARAEAAHAERMAALPGGVADLSEPVAETWRVETDAGVLAVLPGGVVVTQVGTDVLGVDVADGSEVWRHELGPAIDCGPRPYQPTELQRPVERVTCLHGEGERTAVVLGADGAVLGERDLGPARLPHAAPGDGPPEMGPAPDGAVYVVEHVDEMLPELDPQDAADALADRRAAGTWQDPSVRVEDAVTGDVRGEATLALRTADEVARCETQEGPGGELMRWLATSVGVSTTATHLSVCNGVATTLAADGSAVDGFAGLLADGGEYLVGEDGTTVTGADGEERTLPGFLLDPLAVDGADGPWLVAREALAAYDQAGERLWTAGLPTSQVLVRAGGVVVVQNDAGRTLDAVDLASGEVRWSVESPVDAHGYSVWLSGAATDGEVAVLVVQSMESTELVALDLDDGAELWRTSHDALNGPIFTVDGHLLGANEEYQLADGVQDSDAVLVGLGPAS